MCKHLFCQEGQGGNGAGEEQEGVRDEGWGSSTAGGTEGDQQPRLGSTQQGGIPSVLDLKTLEGISSLTLWFS